MANFTVRLTQMDIDYPEGFLYFVYTGEIVVASFNHLDEANAFIVANGGVAQTVTPWVKGIQATAGSTYR